VLSRRIAALIAALALVMGAFVFAGCGDDEEEPANGGGSAAQQEEEKPAIKVGMVTDIGGLDDRSFNQLANEGLERAQSELGVEIRVLTSDQNSDYVPNLSSLAQQQFDLVIAVGFLMGDALNTVATRFPDTNFAIIDFPQAALKDKPANVRGLLFTENEAGYLAGYVAGLYVQEQGGDQVVSAVGGQKVPAVDSYIAGYTAGAEAANPDVEVLSAYSQDFVDQAKCKEVALNQLSEGSQVVFQVAGGCGLGALDAAAERDAAGIGVDADQGYLGDHIITSALKKVDVAVFESAKAVQDETFAGGEDQIFDLASEGVALGEMNADAAPFQSQVEEVQQQIIDGEIADIPSTLD
jgi:basic membrane protein A and related proteins